MSELSSMDLAHFDHVVPSVYTQLNEEWKQKNAISTRKFIFQPNFSGSVFQVCMSCWPTICDQNNPKGMFPDLWSETFPTNCHQGALIVSKAAIWPSPLWPKKKPIPLHITTALGVWKWNSCMLVYHWYTMNIIYGIPLFIFIHGIPLMVYPHGFFRWVI